MLRNAGLAALAGAMAVLATLPAAAAEESPVARRYLTIGSGAVTGSYFPVAGAVCRVVNADRRRHGLRCSVEATDGSRSNALAIQTGDLDLAIIQSDQLAAATAGTGGFAGRSRLDRLRAVARLHAEPFLLLGRAGEAPADIDALAGRRLGLGPEEGSGGAILTALAKARNWPSAALAAARNLRWPEQMKALCAGDLEAAAFVLPIPNPLYLETREGCRLTALALPAALGTALAEAEPWLVPLRLQEGSAPGIGADHLTVAGHAVLAASELLEPEAVRAIVLSLVRQVEALRGQHPLLTRIEAAGFPGPGLGAPLHAGAVLGYREAGLTLPPARR